MDLVFAINNVTDRRLSSAMRFHHHLIHDCAEAAIRWNHGEEGRQRQFRMRNSRIRHFNGYDIDPKIERKSCSLIPNTKRRKLSLVYSVFLLFFVGRQFILLKSLHDVVPVPELVNNDAPPNTIIPVFYNLFVNNKKDASRVMDIVSEQKSFLLPEYHKSFYVQSMGGVQLNITNTTILGHRPKGNEVITLHSLWKFCKKNPQTEKVVYLHSKGSFHPKPKNTRLRKFLTAGALSEECALVGTQCNVCSTRFSPLPHPHTPGNMWLARCDYIRKLIDPLQFEETMNSIYSARTNTTQCKRMDDISESSCVGLGRFSAEHWVHSHPSVKVRNEFFVCNLHFKL